MTKKLSESLYLSITLIAASLMLGGCSNGGDELSDRSQTNSMETPSELSIQSSDSLLFTATQNADRFIQWPSDLSDSLVLGYSFVEPATDPQQVGSFTPGSLLHLSLDENLTVTARVNRNQSIGKDTRSITGSVQPPYTGDITLTLNQNHVTGTVNLYSENRLFYIRYDQASDRHYIAEIDSEKLDIQEGSQPLEMN